MLTYCKVENEKCIYVNKIATLSVKCQLSGEPKDLEKGEDVQNDDSDIAFKNLCVLVDVSFNQKNFWTNFSDII